MSNKAVDRVWDILDAVAMIHPEMSLADGISLAKSVNEGVTALAPPSNDYVALARWLGECSPNTCTEVLAGKIITAIKMARIDSGARLAMSKDAVEYLRENPGLMTCI